MAPLNIDDTDGDSSDPPFEESSDDAEESAEAFKERSARPIRRNVQQTKRQHLQDMVSVEEVSSVSISTQCELLCTFVLLIFSSFCTSADGMLMFLGATPSRPAFQAQAKRGQGI